MGEADVAGIAAALDRIHDDPAYDLHARAARVHANSPEFRWERVADAVLGLPSDGCV